MLIQHHTHYKEIDGFDEIVLMTPSQHVKHHKKLGKRIPNNVSWNAHKRSPKGHNSMNRYAKNNLEHIYFTIHITKGVDLIEDIVYNKATGNAWYVAHFNIDKRHANTKEESV